jgi:hypothetical protein
MSVIVNLSARSTDRFFHPVSAWVWLLAFIVYFQAFVVILQEALGPAFFLPGKVIAPLLRVVTILKTVSLVCRNRVL